MRPEKLSTNQGPVWLARLGSAISQLKVEHASEWVPDFLTQGLFAEAAMQGFVEMERNGANNIANIIESNSSLTKLSYP